MFIPEVIPKIGEVHVTNGAEMLIHCRLFLAFRIVSSVAINNFRDGRASTFTTRFSSSSHSGIITSRIISWILIPLLSAVRPTFAEVRGERTCINLDEPLINRVRVSLEVIAVSRHRHPSASQLHA